MFEIFFEEKHITVYLDNEVFLKQEYIKDKQYTLFFVLHILHKYGMEVFD
jgi:hypothetical protein